MRFVRLANFFGATWCSGSGVNLAGILKDAGAYPEGLVGGQG